MTFNFKVVDELVTNLFILRVQTGSSAEFFLSFSVVETFGSIFTKRAKMHILHRNIICYE